MSEDTWNLSAFQDVADSQVLVRPQLVIFNSCFQYLWWFMHHYSCKTGSDCMVLEATPCDEVIVGQG